MQFDPMKPKLKLPGIERMKLKCDILLSTAAFKFNLRRYKVASSRVGNTLGEGHGALARFRAFAAWSLQLVFAVVVQVALYVHRGDWAGVFARRDEKEVFAAARHIYPVLAGRTCQILFATSSTNILSPRLFCQTASF